MLGLFSVGLIGGALFLALLHQTGNNRLLSASLAVVLLTLYVAVELLRRRPADVSIPRQPALVFLAMFLLWAGLSVIWSSAPGTTLQNLPQLAAAMGALIVGSWLKDRELRWMRLVLPLLGLVVAGLTFYEGLVVGEARPGAFMLNWNSNAAYLNLVAIPLAFYALTLEKGARLYLVYVVLATLMAAEALTLSRGALLGLAVGFAVGMVLTGWQRRFISIILVLAAGYLTGSLLLESSTFTRFTGTADFSTGRFTIWASAWEMYLARPWLGWGFNTFWLNYPPFRSPAEASAGEYVHNDYLQILLELGPLGLGLFLLFCFALTLLLLRLRRSDTSFIDRAEFAGLGAAVMGLLAHTAVDFHLYLMAMVTVFALYVGRLAAVGGGEWRPFTGFTVAGWRALVFCSALIPLAWGVNLVASEFLLNLVKKAPDAAKAIELTQTAGKFYPYTDQHHLMFALQVERFLHDYKSMPEEGRLTVVLGGLEALDAGLRYFPQRAMSYLVRARLMRLAPERFSAAQVHQAAQRALEFDPIYLEARLFLAQRYLDEGDKTSARAVLEEGWHRHCGGNYGLAFQYATQVATLRLERGDIEGHAQANGAALHFRKLIEEKRLLSGPIYFGAMYTSQ